jgi:putative DNA primase/helicase
VERWARQRLGEILEGALGIEPARWTKADQMRVGAYLKTRQWERYQPRSGAVREWRYKRSEDIKQANQMSALD